MKRLLLLFFLPCFSISQINENNNSSLNSIKPLIEIDVGFPWLINVNAGIKFENHQISLIGKSYFIYHQAAVSYNYYISENTSAGLNFGSIYKSSFLNAQKNDFFFISPQISYTFLSLKNDDSILHNKKINIGCEISIRSDFGLTTKNQTIYFMPFASLSIPVKLKKNKKSSDFVDQINPSISSLINTETIREKNTYIENFENSIQGDLDIKNKYFMFKKGGVENDFSISLNEIENIINLSKTYLGTPYLFGGETKDGIDCSGLFYVCFANENIELPRIAEDVARIGELIYDATELVRGDLVFFTNTSNSNKLITHMGLYLGDNDFIHSSSSIGVSIAKINNPYYWKDKFLFGKRIVR